MIPEDQQLLKDLLTHQRVLSLSVLIDDAPYTGLLPYVMLPDLSAALIHASNLAKHTRGLQPKAPFSALIHQPDRPDLDPQQLPRVSLQGSVQKLPRESAAYPRSRDIYLAKFPASAQTFMLGDFNLYALTIEKGRFVAAFGRIYNLSVATLQGLVS